MTTMPIIPRVTCHFPENEVERHADDLADVEAELDHVGTECGSAPA